MHVCVPGPMQVAGALRSCLCGAVRRVEAREETARFARCPLVCLGHRRRARTLLPDAHRRAQVSAAHQDRHLRFMPQGQLWLCGHALSCMGCKRCALKSGMCLNKARHHLCINSCIEKLDRAFNKPVPHRLVSKTHKNTYTQKHAHQENNMPRTGRSLTPGPILHSPHAWVQTPMQGVTLSHCVSHTKWLRLTAPDCLGGQPRTCGCTRGLCQFGRAAH